MKKLTFILAVFAISGNISAVPDEADILAVKNGTLHTLSQGTIQNGCLLIKNGKISAVGQNIAIPEGAKIIDAEGLHIIPGMIDGFTNLGAADMEDQNQDYDEAGSPVSPHLRILDSFNPANRYIPLARQTGVTSVLCAPGETNLFSGLSALISLAGDSLDKIVIRFPVGVHVNLGEPPKSYYGPKNQYPSTRMGQAALFRQTLVEAREYLEKRKSSDPPAVNFKLQALEPVLNREIPVLIRANRLDDILTALRITEEYGLKMVLNHGSHAYRVADRLAERQIPVIVGPTVLEKMSEETSLASRENPAVLQRAGVKIAFQTGSYRNYGELMYMAETAVKNGLTEEEALKALTLYPAEIFGVSDLLGTLEPGKYADLAAFRGEPLNGLSRTEWVIIHGEKIDISRHP